MGIGGLRGPIGLRLVVGLLVGGLGLSVGTTRCLVGKSVGRNEGATKLGLRVEGRFVGPVGLKQKVPPD